MRQATALWLALLVVAAGGAPAIGATTPDTGATATDAARSLDAGAPPAGPSATLSASEASGVDDGARVPAQGASHADERSTARTARTTRTAQLDDPDDDVIGWEEGYWHNESIDVDQSDGLDDDELDAYVSRAMARVEYVREREFEEDVPVSVISREEYREQAANQSSANDSYTAWNNQVWEALFIVGEDSNVQDEIGATLGSSVAGFYSPSDDEIKIVTGNTDSPTVNNATLVHELTHAMQDQYHNLSAQKYRGDTQDGDLAGDGIVEGEANYVEDKYRERCEADEWECVPTPTTNGGGGGNGSSLNYGIFVTVFQPYSDGPAYVHSLYEAGGWDAVERKMTHPPNATEQTIHVTDEEPTPIRYEHNATDGWEPYPNLGENGSDTVGEASLYAMAYYQDRQHDLPGIDYRNIANAEGEYDTYNYTTQATAGWANDRVFPYHEGSGDDARHGYVWVTEWDTERDAREFESFHESVLAANGAEERANGRYAVTDGAFADHFLVHRNGTRVTVVNGPSADAVESIRPGLAAAVDADNATDAANGTTTADDSGVNESDGETNGSDEGTNGEPNATDGATADPTTVDEPSEGTGTDATAETTDDGSATGEGTGTSGNASPGFGVLVAVLALAAGVTALIARRRTE